MLEVFTEDIEVPNLDSEFFNLWLSELVETEDKTLGDVNLIFCSDEYLLKMNQDHLNHDYYTDIITFDYCEGNIISGDLFISYDRVVDNAANENTPVITERNRVVAHGVLHLMGYNDKSESESKLMREMENKALNMIVSRGTL